MASDARGARRAKRAKFADDLKPMLFGFGDDAVPYDDTVSLVEDIVIDFIKSVTEKTVVQSGGNPAKVRLQDLLFAIRKDRPKYNRAKELLACDRLIRKYRKSAAPEIATKLGRPTGDDDSDAPAVASTAAPAVAATSTGNNKPSALVGGSGKLQAGVGVGAGAKVVAFA